MQFRPPITREGRYRVYLYWPRSDALATRVPVVVRHAAGSDTIAVNMRQVDEIHGGLQHGIVSWVPLGTFAFRPGAEAYLAVQSGRDGIVYADAVLFVPVRQRR